MGRRGDRRARASSCRDAGASFEVEQVEGLFGADGIARCAACGGPLKPDVVRFGELLPEEAIDRSADLAEEAELMTCVGSALVVHPVAGLPPRRCGSQARSIRLNRAQALRI